MRTGVTYLGDLNPRHITADIRDMQALGVDDVFLAAQENDFVHYPGKLRYTSEIARNHGIRPLAIFWGALNLFGGGRSSQFLLEHPDGLQVRRDGSYSPVGCYVNPICVGRIQQMIDVVAGLGYQGYFIDEPTPLPECFCASCRRKYDEWYGKDLAAAADDENEAFRHRCVVDYVRTIADYCKATHPQIETMTCLMPIDKSMWLPVAEVENLDNLGTDIYWVNEPQEVEEMTPIVRELDGICKGHGKRHHEWLQCWIAKKGREERILEQGKILIREQPDALYIWAWMGQIGTTETCEDPETAWKYACDVLRLAKEH